MLAFLDEGVWSEWTGQTRPQQGQEGLFELPRFAAQDYHPNKLATFGLKLVTLATVPEGKQVASWSLQDEDGKPVQVAELIDLPGPTAGDVAAERDRRMAAGFDFTFPDARGVHRIGTSRDDMIGWQEVTTAANAILALGVPVPLTIQTDTGLVEISALEWQQVLMGAAAFRQPIWLASFAIAQLQPVPDDFRNDSYWDLP